MGEGRRTKVGEADLSVSRPFQSGMPPKPMMQTLFLDQSDWCPIGLYVQPQMYSPLPLTDFSQN